MRTCGLVQRSECIVEVLGGHGEIERFSGVIEIITSEFVRLNSLRHTGLNKHFYRKVVNVLAPESWTSAAFMFPPFSFLSSLAILKQRPTKRSLQNFAYPHEQTLSKLYSQA